MIWKLTHLIEIILIILTITEGWSPALSRNSSSADTEVHYNQCGVWKSELSTFSVRSIQDLTLPVRKIAKKQNLSHKWNCEDIEGNYKVFDNLFCLSSKLLVLQTRCRWGCLSFQKVCSSLWSRFLFQFWYSEFCSW